jgi:putative transposase
VKKDYQTRAQAGATPAELAVPDSVAVSMTDLAETLREGLLALAVGAGLQVMSALMEEEVTGLCGPRGRHDPARTAVRHGTEAGSVTLGGRRVPVRRPRVRTVDGAAELPVPSYELFSSTELLGRMAMEKMLGQAVDPPLPPRPRTRRRDRGRWGVSDVEVVGVPPLRDRNGEGVGRADGCGPVRC